MTDVPEEAAVAAYVEYQRVYPQRTAPWDELAEWERERFRGVIAAAAPHMDAAGEDGRLARIRETATEWASRCPAGDWGEGGMAEAIIADAGREILRFLGEDDHA